MSIKTDNQFLENLNKFSSGDFEFRCKILNGDYIIPKRILAKISKLPHAEIKKIKKNFILTGGKIPQHLETANMIRKREQETLKKFVMMKLSIDKHWALSCLKIVYDNNMKEEEGQERKNGFIPFDHDLLTSFHLQNNPLTQKQLTILLNRIPKYHRQFIEYAQQKGKYDKLKEMCKEYYTTHTTIKL